MWSFLALSALVCAADPSVYSNLDLTYPYIEVPFLLTKEDGSEILFERNHNNTAQAGKGADHVCAGGQIRLTRRHIGDGICDCCDGSDEPAGACPNHCEAWDAVISTRNKQIIQNMARLQQLRADLLEHGLAAKAARLESHTQEGEEAESGLLVVADKEEEEEEAKSRSSISEYAKWMLPAKEQDEGKSERQSWFQKICQKLKGKKEKPSRAARLTIPETLAASALNAHPEWLYTASQMRESLKFVIGEKSYMVDRLLSITMRETWQHHQPNFGSLEEVRLLDLDRLDVDTILPTRYGAMVSPTLFRYTNGSECKDKFYSDELKRWVVPSETRYSASLFTVCADEDRFIWVEFQKPCELIGVLSSAAACVSPRHALVESLPSGAGRRNEL